MCLTSPRKYLIWPSLNIIQVGGMTNRIFVLHKKINIIKLLSLTVHISIQLHMQHEVTGLGQIQYNMMYTYCLLW